MTSKPPTLDVEPTVATVDSTRHERALSLTYPTPDDRLTLAQLRDFTWRTRNQRGADDWSADTEVEVTVLSERDLTTLTIETVTVEGRPAEPAE